MAPGNQQHRRHSFAVGDAMRTSKSRADGQRTVHSGAGPRRMFTGLRVTRARRDLIDILSHSSAPMTAEAVLEILRDREPHVALSTVYRNLDRLAERGAVHKMVLADQDRALFELAALPHRHYAVCLNCHKVFPLDGCPVEEFASHVASETGFQVTEHSLVLYGYCRACQLARKNNTSSSIK